MDFTKLTNETIDTAFNATIERFRSIKQIDMSRMQYQIKIAREIIDAYQSGLNNVIIEAPTGFGKSILGFFLTEVIRALPQSPSTYILTPNKFLQDQYNRDIDLFGLSNSHVLLKGQSNYICSVTKESFTKRPCAHISLSKVASEEEFSKCSTTCQYLLQRNKAINAQTSIFNYAYWLASMNLVYTMLGNESPFEPRDVTIFDESHLLGDIVQGMFGQDINIDRLVKMTTNLQKMVSFTNPDITPIDEILENLQYSVVELTSAEESDNRENEFNAIKKFSIVISELSAALLGNFKAFDKNNLTEDQKRYIAYTESIVTLSKSIEILKQIYGSIGHDSIVLSVMQKYNKVSKLNETHIVLQCTDERKMVEEKVLAFTKNTLFMSATIGDIDVYAKQLGITNYKAIYIDSDFDFSKSPIYNVTPQIRMNYKEKHLNMPKMLQYVDTILKHHENERGVIHTGNFEFMNKLQNTGNKRFIFYTTADEKVEALHKLSLRTNGVLCGPSILEGVDLKDDLSRFQIFMKVPYMSLGDKLTKRKMDKYQGWYGWVTLVQFLQGLGRSIRHKNDYAVTYLLDGSFSWFLQQNKPAPYINKRIKSININNLDSCIDDEFEKMFN